MIRLGIISPSEIAYRRFLPALQKVKNIEYAGVAYANCKEWIGSNDDIIITERGKAETIQNEYGGDVFDNYQSLIDSPNIDIIYLPLPPALHFEWAKRALEAGKHILIEKPATIALETTRELILLAKKKGLVIHENYMFVFHSQLKEINDIVKRGDIGEVRLSRISFGFPRRAANDFRYNKSLGGGALLDCGGYTIKYASILLGETADIAMAQLNYTDEFTVDLFGSGVLINDKAETVQVSFGMDNSYRCDLEIWGSLGVLNSNRVLTAPEGFTPEVKVQTAEGCVIHKLMPDDSFEKSIERLCECIENADVRYENYKIIERQSELLEKFKKAARYE